MTGEPQMYRPLAVRSVSLVVFTSDPLADLLQKNGETL
jgi:hypothetical protein